MTTNHRNLVFVSDWLYYSTSFESQYEKKGSKGNKKTCECCGKKQALYFNKRSNQRKAKNRVRSGKYHTLCLSCYKSEMDRLRGMREKDKEVAQRLKENAVIVENELRATKDDRDDEKRNGRRSRSRWDKRKDVKRGKEHLAKKAVNLIEMVRV